MMMDYDDNVFEDEKYEGEEEAYTTNVISFQCSPAHKTNEAIEYIKQIPDVVKVAKGVQDDQILILSKSKFVSFASIDWKMDKQPLEMTKFNILPQQQSPTVIDDEILEDMRLFNDFEKANVQIIKKIVNNSNSNIICREKLVFVVLTYDYLKYIGYYNRCEIDPKFARVPTLPEMITLMDYKDLFGKTQTDDDGVIINPLNYHPSGDVALLVEVNYITYALGGCHSLKARSIINLVSRFLNSFLRHKARMNDRAMIQKHLVDKNEYKYALLAERALVAAAYNNNNNDKKKKKKKKNSPLVLVVGRRSLRKIKPRSILDL